MGEERRSSRKRSRSPSDSDSRHDTGKDSGKKAKKVKKDKDKKERKKKKKKDKKDGRKEFGHYGVISDRDMYRKEVEFQSWLNEVKKVPSDSNFDQRKLFAEFVEDFNTVAFPSSKYYDMAQWERKNHVKEMAEWQDADVFDPSSFDVKRDEEILRLNSKRNKYEKMGQQPSFSRQELEELSRVSQERVQADKLRKMGLSVPASMGTRYEPKGFVEDD